MSNQSSSIIVALATPPGEGAIGVLRLSGAGVEQLASRLCAGFRSCDRRMQLVDLVDDKGRVLDRALVCWMKGPRSFTGEDTLEVYAHGGQLNTRRLIDAALSMGARLAEPGEFTRRAFLNGKLDLTQAEAVAAMIAARSERALDNARALLGGRLGKEVGSARGQAIELAADLEACLDFADQHDAPVSAADLRKKSHQLVASIERLVASYDRRGWLDGVTVALVGPVNAGKSSLFNALLGRTRALVSDEEGTTRDYLEAELDWDGISVTLVDTAGERLEMSALEKAGHQLAGERLARCDITIRVVDISQPSLSEESRTGAQLIAANKADLAGESTCAMRLAELESRHGQGGVVLTSAISGLGIAELKAAVVTPLLKAETAGNERFRITERRQMDAIDRALVAARDARDAIAGTVPAEVVVEDLRQVLRALGEVTGQEYTEQILSSIFARFCIGK